MKMKNLIISRRKSNVIHTDRNQKMIWKTQKVCLKNLVNKKNYCLKIRLSLVITLQDFQIRNKDLKLPETYIILELVKRDYMWKSLRDNSFVTQRKHFSKLLRSKKMERYNSKKW